MHLWRELSYLKQNSAKRDIHPPAFQVGHLDPHWAAAVQPTTIQESPDPPLHPACLESITRQCMGTLDDMPSQSSVTAGHLSRTLPRMALSAHLGAKSTVKVSALCDVPSGLINIDHIELADE